MDPKEGKSSDTKDEPKAKMPSAQHVQDASAPQADALGETAARAGLDRASGYVKDAVNKTREKVAAYRGGGMERVSQDIVEYTRSQPVTALLIAAGVGVFAGMLIILGRK